MSGTLQHINKSSPGITKVASSQPWEDIEVLLSALAPGSEDRSRSSTVHRILSTHVRRCRKRQQQLVSRLSTSHHCRACRDGLCMRTERWLD